MAQTFYREVSLPISGIVETAPLVLDIGIVLALAGLLGLLARKVGMPAVIGYLATGLLVSPFTPGYVASYDQLALLADIGVVLLLFEVGIEIDLKRMTREQKSLLWGVPTQVALGIAVGTPIFLAFGIPLLGSLLISLSLAMSSSVVIVNITRSRRRTTDSHTDDSLLAWSVTQDIVGVATAAVIIAIFGTSNRSSVMAIFGLFGFILLAYLSARIIPLILKLVRWEHDLFLIFSVSLGLVLAALGTVVFEIPMALAGFVAGLAINQSRDTDEVRTVILPFRDLFAVLFFVTIGSLIQPQLILQAAPFAAMLIGLLLLLKTLPIYLFASSVGLKARPLQLSVGLSQVGEFSFVLGSIAFSQGALSRTHFVSVLLAVVISIVGSTLAVRQFGKVRRF